MLYIFTREIYRSLVKFCWVIFFSVAQVYYDLMDTILALNRITNKMIISLFSYMYMYFIEHICTLVYSCVYNCVYFMLILRHMKLPICLIFKWFSSNGYKKYCRAQILTSMSRAYWGFHVSLLKSDGFS